ncbi:unnamed protein product [Prorocentrum cordatum]|uniref:Uncharacterized protein n=2 Tax=Prorocentrum cordatum TaxID=2364126 RepID=A0ABN9T6C9_9DINO|nr:unnamed protein product [Polarella glacialis]
MSARVAVVLALGGAVGVRAEGEAYLTELAEEVLSWTQEVLPMPWDVVFNMPTNRDVGSVIDHDLREMYETEVYPKPPNGALETQRELDGFPPNVAIGRALIKESKRPAHPPAFYRGTGDGCEEVRHLNGMVNPSGHTTCWGWEKVRYGAMTTWLNYWASRNSDKIVVFHAAGTMLYAGCDENTIMYKYNEIVSNSVGSPTVVLAAEVSPPQDEMSWRYDISSDAVAARTAFLASVAGADLTTYADCNATVGYCDSPPKYRYASSAFIMGPAGDVAEMLSEMPYWSNSENRLVNEYFLSNTDKVALDYSGILVLSLNNMKLDANIPVTVVDNAGAKSFSNKATGTSVCFVHGAGNSHDALKVLAQQLTA